MNSLKERLALSAFQLKLIAFVCMLADHTAMVFLSEDSAVYLALRLMGRLAFPLYAFLIAEGARRTENTWKYLLRLGKFAVLSEIPYDLALGKGLWDWSSQNALFTLAFSLLGIHLYRLCNRKWPHSFLQLLGVGAVLLLAGIAGFTGMAYGVIGVILPFGLYIWLTEWGGNLRHLVFMALFLGVFWLSGTQVFALAAFLLILLYNGEKGTRLGKYWFYAAYPAHLLILYLIRLALLMSQNTIL